MVKARKVKQEKATPDPLRVRLVRLQIKYTEAEQTGDPRQKVLGREIAEVEEQLRVRERG